MIEAQLRARSERSFPAIWASLRQTSLPFLPILFRDDLPLAHRLCANVLRTLGSADIGFAYALENHLFVLGGIETYLTRHPNAALRARMDRIREQRWFTANTRGFVHGARAFTEGIVAQPRPGGLELNGTGSFVSLAGTADLLLLLLEGDEPAALWLSPRGDPTIHFGELTFPQFLVASDTRPVTCQGTCVPAQEILALPAGHLGAQGVFSAALMAWHLALSLAQFLGGATRVAEQTLEFATAFKAIDNRPIARVDGVVCELGQIGVRFGTAEALLGECAHALERLTREPDPASAFPALLLQAQIANCHAMELAEDISRRCRRILGTRIFSARHAELERIMTELMAGPLVPRPNSMLERDVGFAFAAGRVLKQGDWRPAAFTDGQRT